MVDPNFCWYSDDEIYLQTEKELYPVCLRTLTDFIKYSRKTKQAESLLQGADSERISILGRWNDYLVTLKYNFPYNPQLNFFLNDKSESMKFIPLGGEAFIRQGQLYILDNGQSKIKRIYRLQNDFQLQEVLSVTTRECLTAENVAFNDRYAVYSDEEDDTKVMKVVNRKTNETMLSEKRTKFFMNLNLCRDKLFIGTIDKLIMYKIES